MPLRLAVVVVLVVAALPVGVRAVEQAAPIQQAGAEHLDKARVYFDRWRKVGFPAAAGAGRYALRAEFTTRASSGAVLTGSYTDIWVGEKQWRREAVLGKSRFVRSRNGKKFYRLAEGPDADLLQWVLTVMEPLPTTEHFAEGNWRVKGEAVDGSAVVRVATGHELPDGTPEPEDFVAYWFDASGQLVRMYRNGMTVRRSKFEEFNGASVARHVDVLLGGKVGMKIDVTGLGPAGSVDSGMFTVKGHDWTRRDLDEVR